MSGPSRSELGIDALPEPALFLDATGAVVASNRLAEVVGETIGLDGATRGDEHRKGMSGT